MLAGMAFCVALIMTPRVWVEAPANSHNPQIPVNQLEDGGDCLWCQGQRPRDCDDYDRYFLFGTETPDDACDEHESGPHA
jgi:hypothetical protein